MQDISILAKQRAEEARIKFKAGLITYERAKEEIGPYIEMVNRKSIELAKKYNVRPQKANIKAYLR